ncbi:hypothetical protein B0T10DRAFT_481148 [Thelonectria olida]|uniref:SigF-like NTF2-like domain-containing protein n=1 Tax=Thelonectria olida TaxID=1576542 RepID=A0A9P9AS12_9HYPO|nr:hypothetical protein B0T10DRAFT_481148 [Thelonectria olida]
MDNPVKEISGVIKALAQGSPEQQEATLNRYFLPNASFTHPFCHVPSFPRGSISLAPDINSRWAILGIYRWYRTLSPQVDITIDSAAFDQNSRLLYVTIRQTFKVWFIPFYKAPVRLVSVLQLAQRTPFVRGDVEAKQKYYISSQEDLYQSTECLRFVMPGLGPYLWHLWQLCSTIICVIGSLLFLPVYIFLNQPDASKAWVEGSSAI